MFLGKHFDIAMFREKTASRSGDIKNIFLGDIGYLHSHRPPLCRKRMVK